jgi:hypothetical protein
MGSVHGGFLNVPDARRITRAFTATGTWYKRDKLVYTRVRVQGGGGSGAASGEVKSPSRAAGGAGGYAEKIINAKDLQMQETVTVGGVGSTSSFGSHCSATGGGNGSGASDGGGGTATGGDININGEAGHNGGATAGLANGGRAIMERFGSGGNGASMPPGGSAETGAAGVVLVEEFYAP